MKAELINQQSANQQILKSRMDDWLAARTKPNFNSPLKFQLQFVAVAEFRFNAPKHSLNSSNQTAVELAGNEVQK